MNDYNKNKVKNLRLKRAQRDSLYSIRLSEELDRYAENLQFRDCSQAYIDQLRSSNSNPELLEKIDEFEAVIEHFTHALHGSRVHKAQLYLKIGKYYLEQKEDSTESLKLLSVAIDSDPICAEAYCLRGKAQTRTNEYQKAIVDFSSAIKINPKYQEAYHERGLAMMELGDYKKAIEDFTAIINIDPQSVDAYFRRGRALSEMGAPEKAIDDFSKIIEIDPKDVGAYYHKGEALLKLKKNHEAVLNYSRAIEEIPGSEHMYYCRGLAKVLSRDFESAMSDFSTTIDTDPEYAAAYLERGLVNYWLQNYPKAAEDLKKAIELEYPVAEIYESLRLELPKLAAERSNKNDDIYMLGFAFSERGQKMKESGKYKDALKAYSMAIEFSPEYLRSNYYLLRAGVWDVLGNIEKAEHDCYKVLEVDDKDSRAFLFLGDLKIKASKFDEAIEYFGKAIKFTLNPLYPYLGRAVARMGSGNHSEAILDFNNILTLGQASYLFFEVEIYSLRGFALYSTGQFNLAKKDFETAVELNPDDATASQMIELVELMLNPVRKKNSVGIKQRVRDLEGRLLSKVMEAIFGIIPPPTPSLAGV